MRIDYFTRFAQQLCTLHELDPGQVSWEEVRQWLLDAPSSAPDAAIPVWTHMMKLAIAHGTNTSQVNPGTAQGASKPCGLCCSIQRGAPRTWVFMATCGRCTPTPVEPTTCGKKNAPGSSSKRWPCARPAKRTKHCKRFWITMPTTWMINAWQDRTSHGRC